MTLADVVGETLDEAVPMTAAQGMAKSKQRQRATDRLKDVQRRNADQLQIAQRKLNEV